LQSRRRHWRGENSPRLDGRGKFRLAAQLQQRHLFVGLETGFAQDIAHGEIG
jgi:hypothetical protein